MAKKIEKSKIWSYLQTIVMVALILIVGAKFLFPGGINPGRVGSSAEIHPLAQQGLDYFTTNHPQLAAGKKLEAQVRNFGCHQEVHIFTDGQLAMKLSIWNGQIYELN